MLYLSRDPYQELYISYKQSSSALSVLLYFTLTHEWFSLMKSVNELPFYNYSIVL